MNAKKILFISGWGSGEEIWSDIREAFEDKVSCDFISWCECLDIDVDNNKILKILSTISEPVILVGWSMGGMIGLQAAKEFQEKIAGLVLVSTSAKMVEDSDYAGVNKRVIKAMKLRLKADKSGLLKDFANMCMIPYKDETVISNFVDNAININTNELLSGLSFLINCDLRDQLAELRIPTNILHGKFDRIMKYENAVFLNKNIEGSTLNVIKREGHFLPQRKPEIIINSIRVMLGE